VIPNTPRLIIRFNVTNPTADVKQPPLSVLKWGTPLEDGMVMGPIFEVRDIHYNQVAYIGKLVRRSWPPSSSSYLALHPQETTYVDVDITDEFDFPGAGDYHIRFISPKFDDTLVFGPANEVIGRLPIINRRMVDEQRDQKAAGFTNCNPTQQNQIKDSVNGAIKEAQTANKCLKDKTCSALSTRWFGAYTAANYNYDQGVFDKVHNRLQNSVFNAYCNPSGCGSDVYAYVYPTDTTYTVYLCGAFWSQANERVNTVVHEMSHFNTLGGTQDYAYGKTSCLNLAKSNPSRASHNADNVCYFSEEAKLLMN